MGEEKMYGSPLDNVHDAYRDNIDDSLDKQIKENLKYLDLTTLIPIIRTFLIQQLTEMKWEVDGPVKEYLTYVSASVDLEELDWYQKYFPEDLQLKHTYQLYYKLIEYS